MVALRAETAAGERIVRSLVSGIDYTLYLWSLSRSNRKFLNVLIPSDCRNTKLNNTNSSNDRIVFLHHPCQLDMIMMMLIEIYFD